MDEYIITAKGERNTPIEKELDIILHSSISPIILIDDARLFTGKDDYPSISVIKKQVKNAGKNFLVSVDTDIIHIISNSK
jgi:hypothetical protein